MKILAALSGFFLLANLLPWVLLRHRQRWGLEPFFLLMGAVQLLQVICAEYVIPLGPLAVSPGSAFFYPWTLAAVLLVYSLAGPAAGRKLVYALLLANGFTSAALTASGLFTQAGAMQGFSGLPSAGTVHEALLLVWGTLLLFLESLLIPTLFELTGAITRSFRLQIFLPLATCLTFDSFLFPALAFPGTRIVTPLLLGNLAAKLLEAALIAASAPAMAAAEAPGMTTPLRFRPVLRYLLFELDLQQLLVESHMDPLTRLWNRRYFESALAYEWSRGLRSRRPLAVLSIDLDRLKDINDGLGHAAGDWALRAVAKTMREVARRESDCAARLGGDEFVLLLPDMGAREAEDHARRLVELVRATTPPGDAGKWPRISVSVGVAAAVPEPGGNPQDLLRASDVALYEAKRAGRGRWVVAGGQVQGNDGRT